MPQYDSPIFGLLEGDRALPGNGFVPPFSAARAAALGVDPESGEPLTDAPAAKKAKKADAEAE